MTLSNSSSTGPGRALNWLHLFCVAMILAFAFSASGLNIPPTLRDELSGTEISQGTRNLVICIHGWNPPGPFGGSPQDNKYDEAEWAWLVSNLKSSLLAELANGWRLLLYHWELDANTGLFGWEEPGYYWQATANAAAASRNAWEHGISLGARLPASLRRVHLIAHSAGTWCAYQAASALLANNPYVTVQLTLLDPYIADEVPGLQGSYPTFSKSTINGMASWPSGFSTRFSILESYFADDSVPGVPASPTLGTQTIFSWRPQDINLQVEYSHTFVPYRVGSDLYYDCHSGPILFYGDTINAANGGSGFRLPTGAFPYSRNIYGWSQSLFHRSTQIFGMLPRILEQPETRTSVRNGELVTLSVTATSPLPFTFQWFKRGQSAPISDATFGFYSFAASPATEGDYVVRIKDTQGNILFSDFAKVTVTDAPPSPLTAPIVVSVSPSTLAGLPLPQTQLIRIFGSGFTSTSTLLFKGSIASDPARLRFINANEIDYDIRTDTVAADWTVKVVNGTQQSNLGYFTVVNAPPNTGSLTVNLSPSGAVSAGAQWRVDGGAYHNSGDALIGLTPGSHIVSFKAVSGYLKPADEAVSVYAGANTTATGSYTAETPSSYKLTVNYNNARGYVTKSPNQSTYPAGAVVRLTVSENSGYVFDHWSGSASGSADPYYITMDGDKSITANFAVDTSMGHIQVNISPPQAVAEGAQWKYRNYTAWRASGSILDFIPTGTGYVYFKDIPGWITPDQIQSPIVGGQTTTVNATYIEILGGVQVTLSPGQAGVAGGRWRLDGGPWTESAVTLADVSTGNHLIEFLAIAGWTAPPSQTVSVERGIIATRNGVYAPPAGLPVITAVSPKTGPIAGGTTVTIDGVNFLPGAMVSFGGVAAVSVTLVSPTQITAVTPPHASYGTVALSLTSGGQTVTQANGFSYLNALGSNIELVGQIGGNVQAVAVVGNTIYYGEGPGLVVSDFTNPSAPVERARIALPAIVQDIVMVSNIAFAAVGAAGLYAVDVSTPTAPSIVGFFDTESSAQGVSVSDGLAYVADATAGLQILNVTNSAAIFRAGLLDTAGTVTRVSVGTFGARKYAFVAEGNIAMRVVDVTIPSAPLEVTSVPAQSAAGITDVKLVGTKLYVSDWQGAVKLFDASNPTNLVQTGVFGNVAGAFIDVVGNRLYTCDGFFQVADLAVTPNPTRLGFFAVGGFCYKLVVANNLAFAAMGRDGLKVVNVSNPASMSLRTAIQTLAGLEDVWVSGGVAFVGNDSGLHTVDVSVPARPVRLATLAGERVTDIVVSGGIATLVNYGGQTVRIANVSNPSSPTWLGTYTNVQAWNIGLMGNTPLLAAATRDAAHLPKLDVMNISSPTSPQSTGSLLLDNINGFASAVTAVGSWVFVGRADKALDVVSLANASSPQKVGSVSIPNFFRDVAASEDGNFVYVPSTAGIQVIDVTTKAAPVLGQVVDPPQTSGNVDTVQVVGNRLFADEGGFIFVFDISLPAIPKIIGYYDIPGAAYGISVASDLIFVAGYGAGLSIFRITDVDNPTLSIIGPTTHPQMETNGSPLALRGVASDNEAVARVIWENDRGGSGEALGTSSWSIGGITLAPGQNVITVTAFDETGHSGNDTLTVTYDAPKQNQIVTFPSPVDKTFGDAPITLVASASSGLPVSFSVLSGAAALSNNVLTLNGVGSVSIRASQTGDPNFNAAVPVDRSFNIIRADQVIIFGLLPDKVLSDAPFTVYATASSGLPITYSVISGPATLSSNFLTITGEGTVTVRASQSGNSNFNPATDSERSFDVTKSPQYVMFGALSRQVFGDAPFVLSATASSGLPVSFSVLSGPAEVSGNILTLTGSGLVVLRASQTGDATYAPAPNVDQVLIVAPGNNIITDFQRLMNGMFAFRFYAESRSDCVVQGSTDLVNWRPLTTNQIGDLGFLEFIDTSGTNYNERFYRVAP
jgi:hypothetical protein